MNVIRLELFPAAVTSAAIGGTKNNIKVYVTTDKFYIYQDGTNGPELFLEKDLYSYEGSNLVGWTVVTDSADGDVFKIQRGGCGCGSRLRGFMPLTGIPYDLG